MVAQVRRLLVRLWNALRPAPAETDLAREVASHLRLLEDAYQARGLSAEDARLAALRQFGPVERVKGLQRDERSLPWFDDARQDLRELVRAAVRRPWATVSAATLIAFAVAGTTTLGSVVYGVLFRPLAWPDSDALIRVEETRGGQRGRIPWTISNATYLAWTAKADTVDALGAWRVLGQGLRMGEAPDAPRVGGAAITPSLMQVLRVTPMLGHRFEEDDAATPAASTVLLSHGLWRRAFGGRPEVVGQTVRLDGRPHTVVGVMPETFAFPDETAQLWLPMHVMPVIAEGGMRRVMIFGALARLRRGVTVSQAAAEASARAREAPGLAQAALALFGNDGEIAIAGAMARDVLTREVRPGLLLLLAAVVLLIVTALASVASVQVARAAHRRREVALRAALGAGASRLTRQWVVESVVVGMLGGGFGVALAAALHRVLPVLLPAEFPRVADVRLDAVVVVVSAAATVAASVLSGLVPVWLGRRETLAEILGQDGLTAVGSGARTPAARLRSGVIVSQVAVACVLLVATALLTRSFIALFQADRGYDPRHVLTARVPLPAASTFAQYEAVLAEVRGRMVSAPGIVDVAFANALPFVTSGGFRGLTMPSPLDPARTLDVQTAIRVVTPGFFTALGLRLQAGRPLALTDAEAGAPVVVVNRTFASQYLGGDALGRRLALNLNGRVEWEVVGVVDDMRQGGMSNARSGAFGGVGDPPLPELFFAAAQWRDPIPEIVVAVRTTNDPSAHVPLLRAALRDAAPALALDGVTTMEERLTASLALPRLYAVVLAALGALALGVAGVGVFGVVATASARRTREIGVRRALGATAVDVAHLVTREIAVSLGLGVIVGLVAAVGAARAVASQIYGVSPTDPWSFLVVAGLLVVVGAAACAVPLKRALRVDPLTALRSQ